MTPLQILTTIAVLGMAAPSGGSRVVFRRISDARSFPTSAKCNSTLLWLAAPDASFRQLNSHAEACRQVDSLEAPEYEIWLPHNPWNPSKLGGNLADLADLDALMRMGQAPLLTQAESRFFLLRNQIGSQQLMAMAFDKQNLRLNLVNPPDFSGLLKPLHVLCVFHSCERSSACSDDEEFAMGTVTSINDERLLEEIKRNHFRLTLYQILAILLGFMCFIFALICLLFCTYSCRSRMPLRKLKPRQPDPIAKFNMANYSSASVERSRPDRLTVSGLKKSATTQFASMVAPTLLSADNGPIYGDMARRRSLILNSNEAITSNGVAFAPSMLKYCALPGSKSMQFATCLGPSPTAMDRSVALRSIMKRPSANFSPLHEPGLKCHAATADCDDL